MIPCEADEKIVYTIDTLRTFCPGINKNKCESCRTERNNGRFNKQLSVFGMHALRFQLTLFGAQIFLNLRLHHNFANKTIFSIFRTRSV